MQEKRVEGRKQSQMLSELLLYYKSNKEIHCFKHSQPVTKLNIRKYLPFEKYTLQTHLGTEDVKKRVAESVDTETEAFCYAPAKFIKAISGKHSV